MKRSGIKDRILISPRRPRESGDPSGNKHRMNLRFRGDDEVERTFFGRLLNENKLYKKFYTH